jgi:hypothetical protein
MSLCQELRRRECDAALLTVVDRIGTVAVVGSAAVAHFDECDFVAIEHHEIDLACTSSVVASDRAETPTNQEALGRALGALPQRSRAGAITAPR